MNHIPLWRASYKNTIDNKEIIFNDDINTVKYYNLLQKKYKIKMESTSKMKFIENLKRKKRYAKNESYLTIMDNIVLRNDFGKKTQIPTSLKTQFL